MKAKRQSKIQIFRWISLAFFIVLVTVLSILHQLSVPGFGPIDALCPFGGLETIYKFLAGGEFISKIFTSNFVLLGGIVLLAIFVGRHFCGWICMFGGLQEFIGMIGKKLFKKRFNVPAKIDNILIYLKYLVLLVVLVLTWKVGELIIRPYDPFVAYSHLSTGLASVWGEFAVGLIILGITLIGSLFYDRIFCRYLCPVGAFLGIASKLSFYQIKREDNTCTHCKICDKTCPVNIDISKKPGITSPECINCLECVTDCPTKKETLFTTIFRKRISPLQVGILGLLIYGATIGVSFASGYWKSADQSLEEKSELGILSPDDIKGSNSLKDVAENFNISIDALYDSLNITKEQVPETTLLKEIKNLINAESFEAEEVREIVKGMLGITELQEAIPANPGRNEVLPKSDSDTTPVVNNNEVADPAGTSAFELEGTMTIQDVAKALNITENEVIKKLELDESIPVDRPLRDLKDDYGYTMPILKERMKL